jgi:hypothetical protein
MSDNSGTLIDAFEREPIPVALLRAPAAVGAGAFVAGVATGAIVGPFASLPPASPLTYIVTAIVCAPFLFPTNWYRRHRVLWYWIAAAAAVATIRAVFMAGFLLPYQPPGAWLLKTMMDLLAAAILWIAALALRPARLLNS